MRFRKARGGRVETHLAPAEVAVLASVAADLVRLLTAEEEPGRPRDPLEELVGLSSGPVDPPEDPALRRLLPDAYRAAAFEGDPARAADASAEFRRFTDSDLRAGKRAAADAVLQALAGAADGHVALDRAAADAWLRFLTDVRLVLGVRLDVTDDTLDEPVVDDDPRLHALQVYRWLGWVQESLLSCLEPRRS